MSKIERIDEMDNNKLIQFVKDLMYKNIEIELKIERLNEDIKYNKEVIDEIKDEIDERVFNETMKLNGA